MRYLKLDNYKIKNWSVDIGNIHFLDSQKNNGIY